MVDLTNGLKMKKKIQHGITFANFNSIEYGLHLASRDAPTPDERTVTTSIPYRQGVVDFSRIAGARIYENRSISYTFYKFGVKQQNANGIQTSLENQLMQSFNDDLQDTYDPYYHYVGKCESVSVEDDFEYQRLVITIVFDLYPFKICNTPEGNVLWDPFCFATDVFQDVSFGIDGSLDFTLYNTGQNIAKPTVIVSTFTGIGFVTLTLNGISYDFQIGTTSSNRLNLAIGENEIHAEASADALIATIEFTWYKELI